MRGKVKTPTAESQEGTKVKSMRNLKLVMKIGFIALALCLAASQGKAQGNYMGKFNLPFEARRGSAVLTPGDYTISMELETARNLNFPIVRGGGKSALIPATVTDKNEVTHHNRLTLVETSANYRVQTLDAGEAGLKLSYAVPKNKRQHATHEAELHSQLILDVSMVRR